MEARSTEIPGVLVLEPQVFGDERGFFFESFQSRRFREATGADVDFVQDNHSRSQRGVLRGLHLQAPPHAQGKLVRVVRGSVWDVAVDLRRDSPALGRWTGVELSEENKRQLWIPPGCAHGFLTLSEVAEVLYKTTDYYAPESERTIRWDDPDLAIAWPLAGGREPLLSDRDRAGGSLADALDS